MSNAPTVDKKPSKRLRKLNQSTTLDAPSSISKRTRGRRGALKIFSEMPLDVSFEILGHLHPSDLLRLARTTKDLRHALMSRTSRTVWKNARSNLEGLPECPNDLSEPQYASLLFDHTCHICHAPNSQQVLWVARARFCQKCISDPERFYRPPGLSYRLRDIIPSTADLPMSATRKWRRTLPKYYKEAALVVKSEYEAIETEELRTRWLANKVVAFNTIKAHGDQCAEFLADLSAKRSWDLSLIREARRDAIMEKLTVLGWGAELGKMNLYHFSKHPDVNQPKALTERAWQKMESTLTTFMEEQRVIRLQQERESAIISRCALLTRLYDAMRERVPLNEPIPNIADVVLLNSFRSLILDTPYETTVTLSDFKPLVGKLVEFLPSWREVADTAILDIVRKSSIGSDASLATLPLATTLFNCSSCSMTLHYPRILVHSCLRLGTATQRDCDEPEDLTLLFYHLGCRPWDWATNQNQVTFDESAHKHAKAIFALYDCVGVVPTYDVLQDSDPFIECLTTVSSADLMYKREVMRITQAIYFSRWLNIDEDGHFPWRILGDEDQDRARALAAEQSSNALRANRFILVPPGIVLEQLVEAACMHCAERLYGQFQMRFHLRCVHAIPEPTRPEDFNLHMDAIRAFEYSSIIRFYEP